MGFNYSPYFWYAIVKWLKLNSRPVYVPNTKKQKRIIAGEYLPGHLEFTGFNNFTCIIKKLVIIKATIEIICKIFLHRFSGYKIINNNVFDQIRCKIYFSFRFFAIL